VAKATRPNEHPGSPGGDAPAPSRLITPQILIVIAIAFCTYLGFGMVTVTLPHLVVTKFHGGSLAVGIIVGIYSFSAVLARPSAGRMGNLRGRRWLMVGGCLIIWASFSLMPVAPALVGVAILRLTTGFGEGMFYIGSATLVTDMVPAHRRAEAVGYYSVALYLGSGLGPVIGHYLYVNAGIPTTFLVAGALAATAAALSTRLPPGKPDLGGVERQPLLNRGAVIPGSVLFLGIMGLVSFQAYVPLYSGQLHMNGPQYVFLLYSSVVCGTRLLGARLHRVSPLRIGTLAIALISCGLGLMAAVATPIALYVGAAIFAAGVAMQFPALMGLALSRTKDHERAAVVGTYTAFMDLAQGVGGFVLGVPAALAGYRASFGTAAIFALSGLGLLRVIVHHDHRVPSAGAPDDPTGPDGGLAAASGSEGPGDLGSPAPAGEGGEPGRGGIG
jgi:MFS family permease